MVALRKNAALALQAKVSKHFAVIAAPCDTQDECISMHHT
jgi:pimeloyl-CoA synthetase